MKSYWYLETVDADGALTSHRIDRFPFRIGRGLDNELVLQSGGLSRQHAVLTMDISSRLRLADLKSTNGTRVNRDRLEGSCLLKEGDVVHFGLAEFRLKLGDKTMFDDSPDLGTRTLLVSPSQALPRHFVPHEKEFLFLLAGQGLIAAAQPIVHIQGNSSFGFELLGRANLPPLPSSPLRLFELASSLNKDVELSTAFRTLGIRKITPHAKGMPIFINAHPLETFSDEFFRSLCDLREKQPDINLVVEINEAAVSEVSQVKQLAEKLASIDVRFAYDDFGAGQARLNEIGEVPAHFVKFDMALIQGLDQASERKQQVVANLVRLVTQVGSVALAEGVETQTELDICRQMGFSLVQGYFTGRPVNMDAFHTLV